MKLIARVASLRTDFSRYKNYSPDLLFDVDGVQIEFDIPDDSVDEDGCIFTMSPETFAAYIMRPWAKALEDENKRRLGLGLPPTDADDDDSY